MTHTYRVTGMTCNGCKASVEKALLSIDTITKVDVNLEKSIATIDMTSHILDTALQDVLSDKFTISSVSSLEEQPTYNKKAPQVVSKWKQLQPLFLILGCIVLITVGLHIKNWVTQEAMLDFMGLFFMFFSLFKFFDPKGFAISFAMYDPLAKALPVYGKLYPYIEVTLGVLFLMRFQIDILLIVTLVILGITTIGVTRVLLQKKTIQCACLGTVLKLPMTQATFIENAIMIVMALILFLK